MGVTNADSALDDNEQANLYLVEDTTLSPDRQLLFSSTVPINILTRYSKYLAQALASYENSDIPVEDYPAIYSFGPNGHGRVTTIAPGLVTKENDILSFHILVSGIRPEAFRTVVEWLLQSAIFAGDLTSIADMVHVVAAAKALQAPALMQEHILDVLENYLHSNVVPLDDFEEFVQHAASNHPARPFFVDNIKKSYLAGTPLPMHIQYAELHDESLHNELRTAVGGEKMPSSSKNDGKAAIKNCGSRGWGANSGPPATVTAVAPSRVYRNGADGFLNKAGTQKQTASVEWRKLGGSVYTAQDKKRVLSRACNGCGDLRHLVKDCPDSTCFMCHEIGHIARDCHASPKARENQKDTDDANNCHRCGQDGHYVRDCTQDVMCYNCGGQGHISRQCTSRRKTRKATILDRTNAPASSVRPAVDRFESSNSAAGAHFVTEEQKLETQDLDYGIISAGGYYSTNTYKGQTWDTEKGSSGDKTATVVNDHLAEAEASRGDGEQDATASRDKDNGAEAMVSTPLIRKHKAKKGRPAMYDITAFMQV